MTGRSPTATSSAPPEAPPPPVPGALGPAGLVRWGWRQLTSMRTALVLLLLLTVAAVPGSLVPQEGIDPVRVAEYKQEHPTLAPWFERLSLFDVFAAPWFAAIYLLLFLSLTGCVVPRARAHWAAARARPPAAPRHLDRLPVGSSWTTTAPTDDVVAAAAQALRRHRYRVDTATGGPAPTGAGGPAPTVAAEKGHLRETGNLLFHAALLLLLAAVGLGNLYGFQGSVLVSEGGSFSNTVSAYDTVQRGPAVDLGSLPPFTLTLDRLAVRFQEAGPQRGAPRDFRAGVTYASEPGAPERRAVLRVNEPLVIGGSKVFLLGNGYAPEFTVRDGTGAVVFSGPVPFLPQDGSYTSTGVVKVPGASPVQLGFQGLFLPTAVIDPVRGPVSVFPDDRLPRAVLTAWTGDLGLDDGSAQSVYRLDTSGMTQVRTAEGRPLARSLEPGATMTLPDGQGSITFDGVRRWASLQVSRDPGKEGALAAAVLALVGLMLSLFVPRRRVWLRASTGGDGRTLVEVAGLARGEGGGLADEVDDIARAVRRQTAETAEPGEKG